MRSKAAAIDASLPILSFYSAGAEEDSLQQGTPKHAQPEGTNTMSNKKTAIVASAAALGAIVLGVGGFFASKYALKKRDEARRDQARLAEVGEDFASSDAQRYAQGLRDADDYDDYGSIPPSNPSLLPTSVHDVDAASAMYPHTVGTKQLDDDPYRYTGRGDEFYNTAPTGTTQTTPTRGDDGRTLFDADSPPLPVTAPLAMPVPGNAIQALPRREDVHKSYLDTARSGSGSSVQSEVLHSGRRASSVDLADPGRATWWKHASQWGLGAAPTTAGLANPAPTTAGLSVGDARQRHHYQRHLSDVSSAYSTLRPLQGHDRHKRAASGGAISNPYLQDNSLML